MESPWLYHTTLPVLVGTPADARKAGRLARALFRRHGVICTWFGRRLSLRLWLYTHRYPVSLGPLNDAMRVRALLDFAAAPVRRGYLLALIPCSPEADAFLTRCSDALGAAYVRLAGNTDDPLKDLPVRADEAGKPVPDSKGKAVQT